MCGGARNYTCTTPQCLWPFASNTLLIYLINVLQHHCFNNRCLGSPLCSTRQVFPNFYETITPLKGDRDSGSIYCSNALRYWTQRRVEKELKSNITISGSWLECELNKRLVWLIRTNSGTCVTSKLRRRSKILSKRF